ncbi:DUF6360 family protein [Halobacterium jilantaiense]|uniref:Uncharacterized protein n=1 Tax=Halobacterium jilantaiense TaxID=355548 RepID=A0A1I0PIH9_9EURY|nr:DUF6360 family protein [Halobacterium jilantaiense]SEW14014.1 hypothetical protein SAMN04487945_1705 [Halobacterium jilantaiense]
MVDRVLGVNAYTTFTLLDGELEGHGWRTDAPAVLNVATGGDDEVVLELELDNTATDDVSPHADRLALSPGEARELAAELESYAGRVED